MGGDLGELRGRPLPQNLKLGGRPMYPSPNILRITIIGCEAKYEKRCQGGIFYSEIEVFGHYFGQEKGHTCICYISDFRQ